MKTNNELLEIFKKDAEMKKEFKLSKNTIEIYLIYVKYLLDFLDNKSIFDIEKKDIKIYLAKILPKIGESSYNGRVSAYKKFFDVLMDNYELEDIIEHNPAKDIKTFKIESKEKIPLTKEEQKALLKNVKNPRDYAILTVMINCALRASELIALTCEQYYKRNENDIIYLTETKGGKKREISLNDKCIDAIDKYLLVRKESDYDNLFISNNRTPMNKDNMSKTIKVIAKRSGEFSEERIKKLHNHLCRHTCCTDLYNNGVDIATIARLAGHSNVNTTIKTYVKIDEKLLKEAVSTL